MMNEVTFEWDEVKEAVNLDKHGVSFTEAQIAFTDPHRVIYADIAHSQTEDRFYCLGMVDSTIYVSHSCD